MEGLVGIAGSLPAGIAEQLSSDLQEENSPFRWFIEQRKKNNPGVLLANLKAAMGFQEKDGKLRVLRDIIGLIRHLPGGQVETYEDKLLKEEKKGQSEAASYGIARIKGREFVLFATHWDFFAGSAGVVVGEKLNKAAELATKKEAPLVCIYSSSGIRQQENFAALLQMSRMAGAIGRFKERTRMPYIAVLSHQVWGGISASAVPLADITVALSGTDFGFAGPRVIESYEIKKVPKGAQSAEANVLQRNIDLLVGDEKELLGWLTSFLEITNEQVRRKRGGRGKAVLPTEEKVVFSQKNAKEKENLYKQFTRLRGDIRRPDTEYLLQHCFTDIVPLYSRLVFGGVAHYPAIIAALGKIGEQRVLIIGNQPSYPKIADKVLKIPSSPTPADFNYLKRVLRFGERLGFPVIFFTDTLGAKPTLGAEVAGQSREIAEAIYAGISYKHPVISIITGVLGSGGGLATTPMGDHIAMLESAMAFVAEPTSATAILYNKAHPQKEEVEATINGMRATAYDQLQLGLIDSIIDEPEGGAEEHPKETAEAISICLARILSRVLLYSPKKLMEKRYNRLRKLSGIPLKKT